jgi:hypothetical protein
MSVVSVFAHISVSAVPGHGLEVWCLILGSSKRIFSSCQSPDWSWGQNLASCTWVPGLLSPVLSRLLLGPTNPHIQLVRGVLTPLCIVDKTDPSHLSAIEVKNAWTYAFTPPYVFIVWCLIKHKDSRTLYFYVMMLLVAEILVC